MSWFGKAPAPPAPESHWSLPFGKAFDQFERDFKGQDWIDFTREHAEIPIFAVSFYLWMVFYLPGMLKGTTPLKLRGPFACWNAILAVFSMTGSIRTAPTLYRSLQKEGFRFTVCQDPKDWYLNGPVGLWVGLFIFSKIPELLDTAFLVLQQKRVIFLHWFHHCTVLLYCWHAYHNRVAPGLWFAAMNFMVHSVMYTYYFAMAVKFNWLATPFAPFITTIQIAQMGVGSYVTFESARIHYTEGQEACSVDKANYKLGLAMYGSYLVLFTVLFSNKYFKKKETPQSGQKTIKDELCGVEVSRLDTTGRFQNFSRRDEKNKAE